MGAGRIVGLPRELGEGNELALTGREREVLALLAEGRANKEIAHALECSVRTAEFHISNLLKKHAVSSRLELVARAMLGAQTQSSLQFSREFPPFEVRMFSGLAAAMLTDTVVSIWTTPATPERWAWLSARIKEALAQHDQGILLLTLILQSATPPDHDVRARMHADFTRFGSKLRKFVAVALGESSWMSVVGSVVNGLPTFNGQPPTVVRSVDQGIGTLVAESQRELTPSATELHAGVAELSGLLGVVESRPGVSHSRGTTLA